MGAAILAPPARPGFDDFYHATYASLTAQLNAYLGDPAEAEDVVQEAFLRAWQRWKHISGFDDPASWVRRVAWNIATSRWRRLRREAGFLHRQPSDGATCPLGPDHIALVTALRELRPEVRQVIVLHYLADLPVAQIAADLHRPKGTILSWLHRGRAQLSVLLDDHEGRDQR